MTNTLIKFKQLRSELSSCLKQLDNYCDIAKFDFIVSPCEVNERHGTGILLKRLFPESQGIVSLRSRNVYSGQQDFGEYDFCLSYQNLSYPQILLRIQQQFQHQKPRKILSIPYFLEDFLITIALKELFDVPLCVYIMDDQNIYDTQVPDSVVQRFLESSDLRLGISSQLCNAYEEKFGFKFWLVPPVVEEKFIQRAVKAPNEQLQKSQNGILIGNIWRQSWLDNLRSITKNSPATIDWYGKPNREWLRFEDDELAEDGIYLKGFFEPFSEEEKEFIQLLRTFPYTIIPSAGYQDEGQELARLSLPSRIPFIVAVSNVPIIILGRKDSAAAEFVKQFGLGVTCDYNVDEFKQAVEEVCDPQVQMQIRARGAALAKLLSADEVAEWIWRSLEIKEPIDLRFDSLNLSTHHNISVSPVKTNPTYQKIALQNVNAVITLSEVNQKHGTGTLIKRLFADDSNILSIRSIDQYNGQQNFGLNNILLNASNLNRIQIFKKLLEILDETTLQKIFCVPYCSTEILTAICLKEIFNVPMAVYIMDDQNIGTNQIPDTFMQEFLNKCSLRLAISTELKDAYEQKYGLKFWVLPPVAPQHLICNLVQSPEPQLLNSKTGVLIGNFWSESWFNLLCQTIKGNNGLLDWYGSSSSPWFQYSSEQLVDKGICVKGLISEEELADQLKQYPYAVIPTGTLDERDDLQAISKFSLSSRIIFALATANIPIIIVGNENTAVAQFVKRFNVGIVCDYTPESFAGAIADITQSDNQKEFRNNAANIAEEFSDSGLTEWIWRSLELGQPCDSRFEDLLPRSPSSLVHYIEPPSPSDIYRDFVPVYQVMRRLKHQGFSPSFVLDVGASSGIWSHTTGQIFKNSRFILIDPLMSKYEQQARDYYLKQTPNAEFIECAISNQAGQTTFQVSPDLYGSSLLNPADYRTYETIQVAIKTLNDIAKEKSLTGRGMLKIDVQCAEHLVLEGASEIIHQIDIIIIELSFVRYDPKALIFSEMLELLKELGFRYYDETGDWRSPTDGTLLQKEIVFVRNDILVPPTSRTF